MDIKLSAKPRDTISGIRRYPAPKTTALGGVATGNIKAQEAATAAPTISPNGCTPISRAKGAKTGSSIAVVARFDVISVKKFTAPIKRIRATKKGHPSKAVICTPSQDARPVVSKALAKAIPPPNKSLIPQGN